MNSQSIPPTSSELNWAQLTALIEASNLLNATLDHEEVLRQLMTLVARGVTNDEFNTLATETSGEFDGMLDPFASDHARRLKDE